MTSQIYSREKSHATTVKIVILNKNDGFYINPFGNNFCLIMYTEFQ